MQLHALTLLLIAGTAGAADVVVYRCTDAQGRIALQDKPCADAALQEQRRLPAPTTAPPPSATADVARPRAAERSQAPPEPARAPRRTPQPLYVCERYDGETYESTTGQPQRRWVPLWALGDDPRAPATALDPATIGRTSPLRRTARDGVPAIGVSAQTLGTWVEDVCVPLSAAQICARRREALAGFGRRIFNAGQSEGDRLRAEERSLRAQVAGECG